MAQDKQTNPSQVKLRCADLFCCAGGAAMGLHRAGFEIEGWDIRPQKNYPFKFHLGNALEADLSGFDFVWASPPCQRYTRMNRGLLAALGTQREYPDLIAPVRAKLREARVDYIIENVPGAPLKNSITLCGSMFGLPIKRHRIFESSMMVLEPVCAHGNWVKDKHPVHQLQGKSRIVGIYGHSRGKGDDIKSRGRAMGVNWMTLDELSEAIPPAYSEYLGRQVMKIILARKQGKA